jgi:uncharacterized NAD(P)/FAD-binding protein YdhS
MPYDFARPFQVAGTGHGYDDIVSHGCHRRWRILRHRRRGDLLRQSEAPLRIVLIERSAVVGCGAAYASRGYPFLLNVPASRMSATTAAPAEFLDYAQTRSPEVQPEDFLPREWYGDYLRALLAKAEAEASDVAFEHWCGEVEEVRRLDSGSPFSQLALTTTDGRTLIADRVVLAVGAPRLKAFAVAEQVAHHPAYVEDPLRASASAKSGYASEGKSLLIGTGLTMADAVCALTDDPQAATTGSKWVACSRHGLLPSEQTTFKPAVIEQAIASSLRLAAAVSIRKLTRVIQSLARSAEARGGDWREVIALVRQVAPGLWLALRSQERARFVRHLRPFWEVHRHRLPTIVKQRLDRLVSEGRLEVRAGRIHRIVPRGRQLDVHWQGRGELQVQIETFDRVVNCSGPDYRIAYSGDALWRTLLRAGLAAPDAMQIGIRTSAGLEVIDADGSPTPTLFYVGALLRTGHWEATAVAELRTHCERLAARLIAQASNDQRTQLFRTARAEPRSTPAVGA